VARSLIDIAALDVRVQEKILAVGSLKDFCVVLWRTEPDASGCNWDGSVGRLNGATLDDRVATASSPVCACCSIWLSSPDAGQGTAALWRAHRTLTYIVMPTIARRL
jgi:hypothetical protein